MTEGLNDIQDRSMAQNRRALFDVIDGLKKRKISIEKAELIIKSCHEITDTFRIEIKGVEVAVSIKNSGNSYNKEVAKLE